MVGLRASNTQHVLHYRGVYDLRPFAPVRTWLLQEARAKLARLQVKSERPGLPAGAFAFCGARTARACMMTTIRERFEV